MPELYVAVLPTASHITALEHTGKYFGQIDFLMFLQNLRNTFDTSFPPPFLLHSSPPPFLPFISKRNNRSRCLKWKGSDVVSETDSKQWLFFCPLFFGDACWFLFRWKRTSSVTIASMVLSCSSHLLIGMAQLLCHRRLVPKFQCSWEHSL